ncbi:MAG: dCTP deaminase [Candidatus Altiarchaeota archaeon]|nr:dCTP deaminase [Candidatus Altiarchaeota archaeon]
MILGNGSIGRLVAEHAMIEGYSDSCLESAGYDLRVGRAYHIMSDSFVGESERKTPEVKEINSQKITLKPNEYMLIETHEKVNMPSDIMARILPRSTIFRCGCTLVTAVVDPGYHGTLTMGLKNLSDREFTIEKMARIAQIVFEEVKDASKKYEGKYQGGKVV